MSGAWTAAAAFDAADIEFTYAGARRAAVRIGEVVVPKGAFFAIIGPNGSGKSTLLRLLLGVLRPGAGSIRYEGREIAHWPRRELARRIGVVSQAEDIPFPLSVRELVAMGRYPHLGPWRRARREDELAIEIAMERCAVSEFSARSTDQLSGGELQRVRIARALAQQPATLVLDEPTAQLDVAHEMSIFGLLAGLSREGVTVVVVTHNINLAARFASELLLLEAGLAAAGGPAASVLSREIIERVYGWPVRVIQHPGPGADAGTPQILPLAQAPQPPPPADPE